MGVKSTITLSRDQAIDRAIMLYAEANRRAIAAQYLVMENTELEDTLERLNDKANDGEGFENYSIQG